MKSISKGSENAKDIISFIIIMNNIEEERITVAGNDQLKPISWLNDVYLFFLIFLPEQIWKLMIPKLLPQPSKKRDIKKFEKEEDKVVEWSEKTEERVKLTVENKAFIIKYLMLFASIYSKVRNQDEIDIDVKCFVSMISVIQTPKVGTKVLSLLLASLRNKDLSTKIVDLYIKRNCRLNRTCVEITFNTMVALVNYSEIDEEQIEKITELTIGTIKKHTHRLYQQNCHKIIKDICTKYKIKLLKNKTDPSEKVAEEIIDESYLSILKYIFTFINGLESEGRVEQPIRENYETLLSLISETLSFLGSQITIYMPFVLSLVKLYHKILYVYCEYLSTQDASTNCTIISFLLRIMENNDPFFWSKQIKGGKGKLINMNIFH